jgi:glycosyltransferase involved in cell wall biosynthesis
LLALPKRCPLVVTFRGDDLLGIVGENGRYTRSGRALQAASRFVSRRADRCIVVSAHMRAFLPRGVEAVVAPSGMDLTAVTPVPRAEARRALGVESDGPIVLFAGNPAEKRKRFGLAQEVVSLLPEALGATMYPAWNLKHETVIQWMSAADALLFVSMHEGSPNVVKEALACNLPVVSVPVGDVPERLKGVRNCFLSPNDEAATLAESLASVLMRGERSDGRDHVQDLDENRITQIVLDEYAEARGKAQAPRRPLPESARSG